MFSGIEVKWVGLNSDLSATTNIPVCKFPLAVTVTDSHWLAQTVFTTATTTTRVGFRMMNGRTTGNGTLNLINHSAGVGIAWTAYTGQLGTTNYTLSAGHWLVARYSEAGTVAIGTWTAGVWYVSGSL